MTIEVNIKYLADSLKSDRVNNLWSRLSEQEWETIASIATDSIAGVENELEDQYRYGVDDGYNRGYEDGYADGLAVGRDV